MSRLQLTAILAGALVLILATPADATYPGDNGRIAYGNFITGQIYTINPDGTDRLQVTAVGPTHFADGPSWSPDGQEHRLREAHAAPRLRRVGHLDHGRRR